MKLANLGFLAFSLFVSSFNLLGASIGHVAQWVWHNGCGLIPGAGMPISKWILLSILEEVSTRSATQHFTKPPLSSLAYLVPHSNSLASPKGGKIRTHQMNLHIYTQHTALTLLSRSVITGMF